MIKMICKDIGRKLISIPGFDYQINNESITCDL